MAFSIMLVLMFASAESREPAASLVILYTVHHIILGVKL